MHVHTHTMYLSVTPGNGIEEKVFEQKNSFQERPEGTSGGSMTDRNRGMVPDSWRLVLVTEM